MLTKPQTCGPQTSGSQTSGHHFVFVAPPFSPTGQPDPYFWVLQKWLYEFRASECTLLLHDACMETFSQTDSGAFSQLSQDFHQYLATHAVPPQMRVRFYDPADVAFRKDRPPRTAFVRSVRQALPRLVTTYSDLIDDLRAGGTQRIVLVSWVNNASLRQAARLRDCPVVFAELGPLRKPLYRPTAYWDRQGVNGQTSAAALWSREKSAFRDWLSDHCPDDPREWTRDILAMPDIRRGVRFGRETFDIGLALQVETDSNILAYSKGWTNLDLIENANAAARSRVIKYHPNGKGVYSGPAWSEGSVISFLSSVRSVHTINSSLGMEAVFWGRDARFFGDSPFLSYFRETGERNRAAFVAWFFLRYLCPWECVFHKDYYDWRLAEPDGADIAARHIHHYRTADYTRWPRGRLPTINDVSDAFKTFGAPYDTIAKMP